MTSNKFDDCLYNWIFHFNPYTNLWSAFRREDYAGYWNDPDDPKLMILKSTEFKTLIAILHQIECDPEKLAKL